MDTVIAFIVGMFIGAVFGFVIAALCASAGDIHDLEDGWKDKDATRAEKNKM